MILSNKLITKVLTRLCGCAGWSVPLLLANPKDMFSHLFPPSTTVVVSSLSLSPSFSLSRLLMYFSRLHVNCLISVHSICFNGKSILRCISIYTADVIDRQHFKDKKVFAG